MGFLQSDARPIFHQTAGSILATVLVLGASSVISFFTARSYYLTQQPFYKAAFVGVGMFLALATGVMLVTAAISRWRLPGGVMAVNGNAGQTETEKALVVCRADLAEIQRRLTVVQEQYDDTEWLRKIAASQATAIQDCIDIECRVSGHKLIGDNPYLDFLISITSRCVYKLSLSDEINGLISFGNHRFASTADVTDNQVKDLAINQRAYVDLHQRLTETEAIRILNEQGSFLFYGLTTQVSTNPPGLLRYRLELRCATSIDQGFIDANYPKLNIQIEPSELQGYYGYRVSKSGTELPHEPLGTILNLKVKIENWRPLKVRLFKLVTSGPVVVAETGEIKERPYRNADSRKQSSGKELYPNLADQHIDVDRNNKIEGWLQFIVSGVPPEGMVDPSRFVLRLHVIDESGEEHLKEVTGLKYGMHSTIDWTKKS